MSYGCPRSLAPMAASSQKMLCPNIYGDCVDGCAILDCRTSQSGSASHTIHGCQLIPSTLRSWSICITRSQSLKPYSTILSPHSSLARVGIVDTFRRTSEHGTLPNLLRCELAAVGYREISLDRLTGSDAYLAIFVPPSVASRTRPEAMIACKAPKGPLRVIESSSDQVARSGRKLVVTIKSGMGPPGQHVRRLDCLSQFPRRQ